MEGSWFCTGVQCDKSPVLRAGNDSVQILSTWSTKASGFVDHFYSRHPMLLAMQVDFLFKVSTHQIAFFFLP